MQTEEEQRERTAGSRSLERVVSSESFRCGNCSIMQPSGAVMVWVPVNPWTGKVEWNASSDRRVGDFVTTLEQHLTGWCEPCAGSYKPELL